MPIDVEPDRFIDGPMGPEADRRPPAFLYDLVPQGKGRQHLLEQLRLADGEGLVLPLAMAGAIAPIGCLRLQSAMEFFEGQARSSGAPRGFDRAEVRGRVESVLEHLASREMLAAGTTGVQGVAPKFLLSTDQDGRWFPDLALPDERAREHWLVKLPRGSAEPDRAVLRNEAAYLRLAAACGLRTLSAPELHGDALFVRRFDRQVIDGQVHRLHQESLASICGLRGFGIPVSQQTLLAGLRAAVADPLQETIEFMKRDVLNLAMRNADNHARNTAVQRLLDGTIQLTPVFDFAPMYLDSEVVTRTCHWRSEEGKSQDDWTQIVETLEVGDDERGIIAAALCDFACVVAGIPAIASECGIEPNVIEACRGPIDRQAEQLQRLSALVPPTSIGSDAVDESRTPIFPAAAWVGKPRGGYTPDAARLIPN
ncbi:type II toxin-antitoxin system HipA family toxin [Variovorax sp. JS1663]|uniref:type II toxin-antitoxin system HipA family toxin n=1 Tax=Variovorax sp. JS1663 TaxID=1851577 RepID=UPI0013022844|nr:HipA domain-containing protein [Variovorax sp. JS1663]